MPHSKRERSSTIFKKARHKEVTFEPESEYIYIYTWEHNGKSSCCVNSAAPSAEVECAVKKYIISEWQKGKCLSLSLARESELFYC